MTWRSWECPMTRSGSGGSARRPSSATFPFCFDPKDNATEEYLPPGVGSAFMSAVEDLTVYDPHEHGWLSIDRKKIFEGIEFRRIWMTRSIPEPAVFGGVEGSNQRYLLWQLLHFQLTFKEPVKTLYVQAVGGPLGVPTGEFLKSPLCTHGEVDLDPDIYEDEAYLVPCQFAPRSGAAWPNVFIYQTAPGRLSNRWKIPFRFRWTETQCHETGFFQFIMYAESYYFKEYLLSPVYRFAELDHHNAVASPFHPFYDKVTCAFPPADNDPMNVTSNLKSWINVRVIGNRDYEDCVISGKGRGNSTLDLDTCPPGPLECDKQWKNATEWRDNMELFWRGTVREPTENCCQVNFEAPGPTTEETLPPTATTQRPLTKEEKVDRYLKQVALMLEKKSRITHGDICILIWYVLIPISDTVARFFKDFKVIEGLGLGVWMIVHMGIHTVALLFSWWSYGLVIGGGERSVFGVVYGGHLLSGTLLTVTQHTQWFTGMKRRERESRSFNYVLIHSLSGYLARIVSMVSMLMSNATTERRWLCYGLFGVWMTASVAFYFVDRKQDKILEVVPHRAQCPVLQRIVMDGGASPPLAKLKIGILAVTVLLMGAVYMGVVVYYPPKLLVSKLRFGMMGPNGTTAEASFLAGS